MQYCVERYGRPPAPTLFDEGHRIPVQPERDCALPIAVPLLCYAKARVGLPQHFLHVLRGVVEVSSLHLPLLNLTFFLDVAGDENEVVDLVDYLGSSLDRKLVDRVALVLRLARVN